MTPRLLLILTLLVGGCASARGDIPPGCDGRDRRPANPYGSILVPSTPAPPEPSGVQHELPSGGCA